MKNETFEPVVLDIGANAGIYGLFTASLGCTTYFFDIQRMCHVWLRGAIVMNNFKHAHLIPKGASNTSGEIQLEMSNSCHGGYRISKSNALSQKEMYSSNSKQNVSLVRLDEVFAEWMEIPIRGSNVLRVIQLVKIDTEGHEPLVVSGMQRLLASGLIKNVVVELTPSEWSKHSNTNMTRVQVANIFATCLWDVGFTKIVLFKNNNKCCDQVIRSRDELIETIAFAQFQDGMQDAHFELESHGLRLPK